MDENDLTSVLEEQLLPLFDKGKSLRNELCSANKYDAKGANY